MENAKMNSLIAQYPLVKDLVPLKETPWSNPGTTSSAEGLPYLGLTEQDVQDHFRHWPVEREKQQQVQQSAHQESC